MSKIAPFKIAMSAPMVGETEVANVVEALRKNELIFGSYLKEFEEKIANYCGVEHAIAVSSGTSALHVALRAVGVEAGDEVIVPTLTFIAPANAVTYMGATPHFLGCDRHWQMDPLKLRSLILGKCKEKDGFLYNKETGRKISALIAVHYLGHPCDIDSIREELEGFKVAIVEDSAQGLGAKLRGRPAGSLGDIACMSFFPNKLITAAGGGMVLTQDADVAKKVRYWINQAKDDALTTSHHEIGYNYRLSNLQAAVGTAQVDQVPSRIERKTEIYRFYESTFAKVAGIDMQPQNPDVESAFWMSCIEIDEKVFGESAAVVVQRLRDAGIEAHPAYEPLHLSPAHAGAPSFDCASSEELVRRSICLPCSYVMTDEEQTFVVNTVLNR